MRQWITKAWYQRHWYCYLLWPLSWLYFLATVLRRWCYAIGLFRVTSFDVPIIVVGNITVGGVGKTPLVSYLAKCCLADGKRVGLVSRGYGGQATRWPVSVTATTAAHWVGDEAVMLVAQTGCPMVVGPDRVAAIKLLLAEHAVDVVISDDGLQHYAMQADLRIAVCDAVRQQGNGMLLPAGPLREPVSRLAAMDAVVYRGAYPHTDPDRYIMQVVLKSACNVVTGQTQALADFRGRELYALAGIGAPEQFFMMLANAGLSCQTTSFVDHHQFTRADIDLPCDTEILMTEKDAVKCREFADQRHWYVPLEVVVNSEFKDYFIQRLHILLAKRRFTVMKEAG